MLRASNNAISDDTDESADLTTGAENGEGVAHGETLIAFTNAAVRGDDLDGLRAELVDQLGAEAAAQAVSTVAAFCGYVRVAEGTGIPIDEGLAAVSAHVRNDLGLDEFVGAANSPNRDGQTHGFHSVDALWEHKL